MKTQNDIKVKISKSSNKEKDKSYKSVRPSDIDKLMEDFRINT